jgi:hypothetical protein
VRQLQTYRQMRARAMYDQVGIASREDAQAALAAAKALADRLNEHSPEHLNVSLFTRDGDLAVKQVTAWEMASIYEGSCVHEGR